jgi:hypothetical protein
MSGKPNEEGVAALAATLRALTETQNELAKQSNIAACASKRVEELSEQFHKLSRQMQDQLVAMDVDSKGNAGWSGRITWMMCELTRQLSVTAVEKGAPPGSGRAP